MANLICRNAQAILDGTENTIIRPTGNVGNLIATVAEWHDGIIHAVHGANGVKWMVGDVCALMPAFGKKALGKVKIKAIRNNEAYWLLEVEVI